MDLQDFDTLAIDQHGPILTLSFNRPDRLNAWNPALIAELGRALRIIARTRVDLRVVIIAGAGRAFSAGGDMEMFSAGLDPATTRRLRSDFLDIFDAVTAAPQVFIAAVHGHCVGSALVLAGCCDFRLAAEDATFHFPEIHVGMLPGIGVARIAHVMPDRMLRALLIAGRRYDAALAHAEGFVDTVTAPDGLMEAARALADEIVAKPAQAVAYAKQVANHARAREVRTAHEFESVANHVLIGSDEVKARAKAFLDRSARSASQRDDEG